MLVALLGVMRAIDRLRLSTAHGLLGLGNSEVVVLARLSTDGPTSPSALAAELQLTSQAMTALVDRLVAEDLVRRGPHPRDRRRILVELTEIGDSAMRRYLGQIEEVLERGVEHFLEHERAIVVGFLRDVELGLAELPVEASQWLVVEPAAAGPRVVRLAGELDMASVQPLRTRLREVIQDSETDVVIDVSELTYLPSAGIRMLGESLQVTPGHVRIRAAAGSHSARVLQLVGLDFETPAGE
jgi:anti-anti-sigma factor